MSLFSSALFLAATCLLVRAGIPTEKVITCAPEAVHRLSCDTDGVISVQSALYGRMDGETCSQGKPPSEISNTDCSLVGTTSAIKTRCDGKKVCELNKNVLGDADPCSGTAKYLQTTYTCFPAIHQVICEHSLAYLHCDEGQIISVYGADYGRRDQTTCAFGRPASQIQNTVCSNPTLKVGESCNGKNSCIINASNSVFGDPCVGTYKYLEVAYACQYPVANEDGSLISERCQGLRIFYNQPLRTSTTMLHFRLSTALLIEAVCLLVASVSSTERAISCDDDSNVHRLGCDTGGISVQSALYGRADRETCSEGRPQHQLENTRCSQAGTLNLVKNRCDGKKVCEFRTHDVRTSDPCYGIFKYLDTNYTCLVTIQHVACEHSYANLYCDEGQVIFVYGADYGRRDQTTCSYQRPPSQTENVYCSHPTKIVAERCNGKNRCTFRVRNSLFGDPCAGTFKYLEVAYVCNYPGH
ncbi:rhamnose-binding lectin-like [Menidia menidia]